MQTRRAASSARASTSSAEGSLGHITSPSASRPAAINRLRQEVTNQGFVILEIREHGLNHQHSGQPGENVQMGFQDQHIGAWYGPIILRTVKPRAPRELMYLESVRCLMRLSRS